LYCAIFTTIVTRIKTNIHGSVREVANGDTLILGKVLDFAFESLLVGRLDAVAVNVDAGWCA